MGHIRPSTRTYYRTVQRRDIFRIYWFARGVKRGLVAFMKQCCASYDASHSHDLEQVHEEGQDEENGDGAGDGCWDNGDDDHLLNELFNPDGKVLRKGRRRGLNTDFHFVEGLCSLSGWTYGKISRSLEATRLGVMMIMSLWNLTGMHLGSVDAELPVKFQRDRKSLDMNLPASRLHEILW